MIITPSTSLAEEDWPSTPADFAELYLDVARQASRLLARHMKRRARAGQVLSTGELGVAKAYMDLSVHLLSNPFRLARTQIELMRDHLRLAQHSLLKSMGLSSRDIATPASDDPRFDDQAWSNHFLFDFLKQSYLITSRHVHEALSHADGIHDATRGQLDTLTHRYLDALSPSNFALTNPAVWRETVNSRGRNLTKGLKQLLNDLQTDALPRQHARELGIDLANTPGQVVFENELLQLIQYAPATPQQFAKPLLIIPPWLHKYYLFDLRADHSFVKWCTDQGFTTFIISWVNPDAALAERTFADYLTQGTLAALRAVQQVTGERKIHLAGYCLAGALLMATLAYMAAKRDYRAASATFLASTLDFSATTGQPDHPLPNAPQASQRLRNSDLLWSFVVNHYLLGREAFPDDLLYWNTDVTRLPTALHAFHQGRFQSDNALAKPGALSLAGVDLDVRKVKVPCYFLATIDDQIAAWSSVYLGTRLPRGPFRFVLGGSGHLTGIVDPPATGRHGYWTAGDLPANPKAFLAAASHHPGSWWTDWRDWLLAQDDRQVDARWPGESKLRSIEEAPGRYARD
ncbi:MAG TPA: class I poly(R)-hydroxyalkanoic acid synthase [Accumulibacter sp.]|nr:class I poly(R)-hydroxyalkanoic acid synthase [Accumulibacter sp.]